MRTKAKAARWVMGGLVAFVLLCAPAAARAQEGILSFHADITVNPDASLLVVETIRVRGDGRIIDHGIYRDFPTRTRDFVNHLFPFAVVDVARDGHPEPYSVHESADFTRVKIGDEAVHLAPGEQTYTLRYRTSRQLRHLADHDELYWNVTGNAWRLRIDEASAAVHLPAGAGARAGAPEGYTGVVGSKASDLVAARSEDGATFRTTLPLLPGEGLTIVLPWPKGFVRVPTAADARAALLRDNWMLALGALGALALFVLVRYRLRTRPAPSDAAGGVVTEPPDGLSPAALRYVTRMGSDDETFGVTLMSLADRGLLTIGRDADWTFRLSRVHGHDSELPDEERAARDALFSGTQTLRLESASAGRIGAARGAVATSLKAGYRGRYFYRDTRFVGTAVLLSLATLAALAFSAPGDGFMGCAFMTAWLAGWTAAVVALALNLVRTWSKARREGGFARIAGAIFTTLFALPFFAAEVFVVAMHGQMSSPAAAMLVGIVLGLDVVVFRRALAPTALGVAVQERARGYAAFLGGAASGATATKEVQRAFTYAVALGAMDAWAAGFVRAGATVPFTRPLWWQDGEWDSRSASELSTSFSSAAASSSSSSSGSDGGGSSGGGGGGGGGGGW